MQVSKDCCPSEIDHDLVEGAEYNWGMECFLASDVWPLRHTWTVLVVFDIVKTTWDHDSRGRLYRRKLKSVSSKQKILMFYKYSI